MLVIVFGTVLSGPTRLRLVSYMHEKFGATVAEFAAAVGITENAASQSLRALRARGWVVTTKSGRTVRYRVVADAIVHRILHDIMGAEHPPRLTPSAIGNVREVQT